MKRTVKLIATDDKRYKDTPYPFMCVMDDSIGTYLTGQHIDPNDQDTYDNLTLEEMTGQERLSAEKKKRFPFVIDPLKRINFNNRQVFDLSKDGKGSFMNPKDAALVNLLRNYTWFVAGSRDEIQAKKHYFYLHDEIYEAEQKVSKADKIYEAQKFVREDLASDGMFDVALVLSYKLKDFIFDPKDFNPIVLKEKILETCEKKPDKILECKTDGHLDEVFILKLSLHDIIKRRGTDFYDGSKFLGKDLYDLRRFMKQEENMSIVSKWNRLLAEKEGRLPGSKAEPGDKKQALYAELEGKSVEELKKFAGSKRYPKAEWGEMENADDLTQYLLSKVN